MLQSLLFLNENSDYVTIHYQHFQLIYGISINIFHLLPIYNMCHKRMGDCLNNYDQGLSEEHMQSLKKRIELLDHIEKNLLLMKDLARQAAQQELPAYKRVMINQTFQHLQKEVSQLYALLDDSHFTH